MFKRIITLIISALVLVNILPKTSALETNLPKWSNTTTYLASEDDLRTIYWTKGIIPPKMPNYNETLSDPYSFKKVEDDLGVNGKYVTYIAPWEANKGWYDTKKVHNVPDNDFCAGYTAINMLYYWMDQNKVYLDRYLDDIENGRVTTSKGSDLKLLKDFVNGKQDASYWTENGTKHKFDPLAKWYTQDNGIRRSIPSVLIANFINGLAIRSLVQGNENPNEAKYIGGFFTPVFGKNNELSSQDVHYLERNAFGKTIQQKIMAGEVLGIAESVWRNSAGQVTALHAINLWGAEYDSNNVIQAIYISDNNELLQSNGMQRYQVYSHPTVENNRVYISTLVTNDPNDIRKMPYVDAVYPLRLGTEMWEAFYMDESVKNLTATYGDTLSKVSLPAGYTWSNPSELVGNVGTNSFNATKDGQIVTLQVKVNAKEVSISNVVAKDKIYDGSTNYSKNDITKVNFSDSKISNKDYKITSVSLTSKDVNNAVTLNISIELTNNNYSLTNSNFTTSIKITPADYEFSYTGNTDLFIKSTNKLLKETTSNQADGSSITGTLTWHTSIDNANKNTEVTNDNIVGNSIDLYYKFKPNGANKNYKSTSVSGGPITFTIQDIGFNNVETALQINSDLVYGKAWQDHLSLNSDLAATNGEGTTDKTGFTLLIDEVNFENIKTNVPDAKSYNYKIMYQGTLSNTEKLVTSGQITIKPKTIKVSQIDLTSHNELIYNGTKNYTIENLAILIKDNNQEINKITKISGQVDNKNTGDRTLSNLNITLENDNKNYHIDLTGLTAQVKIKPNPVQVSIAYDKTKPSKQEDGTNNYNGSLVLTVTGLVGDDTKAVVKAENLSFDNQTVGEHNIQISSANIKVYVDGVLDQSFFSNYSGYTITTPSIKGTITAKPAEPSKPSGGGGGGHKGGGGGGKSKRPKEPIDTSVVAPNVTINSYDKNTRAMKDTLDNKFKSYSSEITKKYSDVTTMKNAMLDVALSHNETVKQENIVFFDLKVQKSTNGKDWSNSNSKVEVTIPFPEGSSLDHNFIITHILDNGEIEILDNTVSENGITFTTSSFSPFSIAWIEKDIEAYELTPAITTIPATKIETDTVIITKEESSKLPLILGIGVIVVALGSSAVIINKKKHK